MRRIGLALVVAVFFVTAQAATAQETLVNFIRDANIESRFTLECFQAGQKVFSESDLQFRIRGLAPGELRSSVREIATSRGFLINIAQTADLACIATQTK